MKFEILWTEDAAFDLEEIIKYINENSGNDIAENIFDRISFKVKKLQEFPKIGNKVPELQKIGINHIYQLISNPWKIYYKIVENKIVILTVIDGRRNLEDILYYKIINGKLF